ncbi:MAG: 4'-phosphopantetheinyl transferase [Kiritimatiellia bacterium]|jgi:4'-phosphopantetheinyl transferase
MPIDQQLWPTWPVQEDIPPLEEGEVQVWLIPCPAEDLPAAALPVQDRDRYARFGHLGSRRRFAWSRKVLRELIQAHTGRDPADQVFVFGDHEKPSLPDSDIFFNLSHSGAYILIAIGRENHGVDIERMERKINLESLARRYFSQPEYAWWEAQHKEKQAFFKVWTHKESYLKATGQGISIELAGVDRSPWLAHQQRDEELQSFCLEAPGEYEAAITCSRKVRVIRKFTWVTGLGDGPNAD